MGRKVKLPQHVHATLQGVFGADACLDSVEVIEHSWWLKLD